MCRLPGAGTYPPGGVPGSYDPILGLAYWGIAVPLPFTRIVRRGTWDAGDGTPCELYSNSTVALDVNTGEGSWGSSSSSAGTT